MVENVLKDDGSVYRAVNACLDLTLANGKFCFVAEAWVHAGDSGPKMIEVYSSDLMD